MFRSTTTQFVIFAVLLLSCSQPIVSQTPGPAAPAPPPTQTAPARLSIGDQASLKKLVAQNEQTYRARSASVDARALEKIERRLPRARHLTGVQIAGIVLAIVGGAALLYVVATNGKACLRTGSDVCGAGQNCSCSQLVQSP